jgi:uncharacterized membrane protein
MQCPVCHNEVGPNTAFCNHCGASLAAAAPSAAPPEAAYVPPPTYAQVPPGYAAPVAGAGGLSEASAAALAYIFAIPAIIFLLIEPYNKMPLVRFHSFQSIALVVVWIVFWVAMTIIGMVLIFMPVLHLILFPLNLLIGLGFFIAWLMAIIKASKGEWFKLPVIGDFAMKQAQGR